MSDIFWQITITDKMLGSLDYPAKNSLSYALEALAEDIKELCYSYKGFGENK